MKNLIKLTLVLSLFFGTLYAQNINECKTDIYFGNGVWNSRDDAKKSIIQLQYIIDTEVIKNDPKLQAKYGQIKLQYNTNYGGMIDILETFYQLKEAGQIGEALFFTFVDELMAKQVSAIVNEDVKTLREQIINLIVSTEATEVDSMLTKYYEESFKLSHKVLLISHSQGNLFANRIYEKINPTGYKDYFANMQIASPASEVKAQKGDYVTLSTDLTSFDPVINFIPGSMSPNASGDSGHSLVSAYLSQADPLSKITTKIKQLLANLDTEPSQWELDNELNKGTKDYKITLKHRFDTTITSMQDVAVYPFNASKKLYHVIDNTGGNGWVKASCGGEKVSDDWEGKKDGEAYLIDNKEEEKIVYLSIPLYSFIAASSYYYSKDKNGIYSAKYRFSTYIIYKYINGNYSSTIVNHNSTYIIPPADNSIVLECKNCGFGTSESYSFTVYSDLTYTTHSSKLLAYGLNIINNLYNENFKNLTLKVN
ncbi:MAG: hypothetical protein COA30_03805 [Sulfurimonas sp.]|nr:MAG: hypothetical protein COA30_03805 [Sulfurimonas sp.]